MTQREFILPIFKNALEAAGAPGNLEIEFETPKNPSHGDLSTNIAMKLAKALKKAPRQIAQSVVEALVCDETMIEKVDIAGPGFINVKFSNSFYARAIGDLVEKGDEIGLLELGAGKKINVEYVSANPTGFLHIGHGRNAAIGDTIANLYEALGWDVTREYYFNNAGKQMTTLANSVFARYKQALGHADFPFPEDGYMGDYVRDIAAELIELEKDKLAAGENADMERVRKFGENWCFGKIKRALETMNVRQDLLYNEDSLYKSGKIEKVIDDLKEEGLAYEKEGAVWLALSKMGMEDDRVIVKSTGEPTYRLPDIAYHIDKIERGFDLIVDIFGADHIATIPDVQAAVKALGFDVDKIKAVIHQFVTLTESGKQVKMSKRSGKSYTLDDLLEELGADVTRFFFIMRGVSTHLEFDLDLARQQSEKNPAFYLQYAHARICSIFEEAKKRGVEIADEADFSLLVHQAEIDLIKEALRFESAIVSAAEKFEPHILSDYLRDLAGKFHAFYHECRILGSGDDLAQARLKLASVARAILKSGLSALGVSAPEKM